MKPFNDSNYNWYLYHIYQPLCSGRIWHKVIFKRSLTGFNSEFSFSTSCLAKAEEPSLPYYLPIAGGRIIGFIPFARALVLCEMQSVSSRIWTRVVVSISYNDNHYTTGHLLNWYLYHRFQIRSRYLFLFLLSHDCAVEPKNLFLRIELYLVGIEGSVFIRKSQRILSVSFFRIDFGLSIYFLYTNFNFLHLS